MGIVGVSTGLDTAQRTVLSPLASVGTDILVTRTVAPTSTGTAGPSATAATPAGTPAPTPSAQGSQARNGDGFFAAGPPGGFGGRAGGPATALDSLNAADTAAVLNENSSVITDLSKLGAPGTKFTHDFFLAGTLLTFPDAAVTAVKGIAGVSSVTAGLTLQAQHQTGTVPNIVATIKTGGETLTSTVRPAPLTAQEQTALRDCVAERGGFPTAAPRPQSSPGTSDRRNSNDRPRGLGGFAAAQECLPKRFQEYQANVVTPLRTIQQVVNPPSTDTTTQSYTAAGVDPASPDAGLITSANVSAGSWFSNGTSVNEVLVSTAYATKQHLAVGDTLPINGTDFTVVGLVQPTLTGNTADVYFDLAKLQGLSSKDGRVNEVLVKVRDAAQVDTVAAQIRAALPGAQVVTGKDVANRVTGSLHNAQELASRLGGALAVIVLLAAFVIAVLLTLSSVGKRVREIGTLRALGWSRRRVVAQIVTETAAIGVLGGVLGVLLGFGVSSAVAAFSPELTATTTGVAAGASSVGSLFGEQAASGVTHTIALTAPITLTSMAIGIACAVLGGLLAGAAGGWRAARLSPAVALRDLG